MQDTAIELLKRTASSYFTKVQQELCENVEAFESSARFSEEVWTRSEEAGVSYGGGGVSRLLKGGQVFEQAGINFSKVEGILNAAMSKRLTGSENPTPFFATGVSLVLHPRSPHVPTTHANGRFLQVGDLVWCGGGADLTPYILKEADARHFHHELKLWCDRYSKANYRQYKQWCDEYFYNKHRQEGRGIGGVFFDYLGKEDPENIAQYLEFTKEIGAAFAAAYFPIARRNKDLIYTEQQREFQLLRRGRYVEFNLLHDRGTKFGLETGGRIQSILMSLPPLVRWDESYMPSPNSPEANLLETLANPRDWI